MPGTRERVALNGVNICPSAGMTVWPTTGQGGVLGTRVTTPQSFADMPVAVTTAVCNDPPLIWPTNPSW